MGEMNKKKFISYLKHNGFKVIDKDKEIFAHEISEEYESILEKYENHDSIDYALFQATNPEYFELSKFHIFKTRVRYYMKSQFFYHLIIIAPPIIILAFHFCR